MDKRATQIERVKVAADRRTVSLLADGFRKGRVYEVHLDGISSADGDHLLHPEGYYTLNEFP